MLANSTRWANFKVIFRNHKTSSRWLVKKEKLLKLVNFPLSFSLCGEKNRFIIISTKIYGLESWKIRRITPTKKAVCRRREREGGKVVRRGENLIKLYVSCTCFFSCCRRRWWWGVWESIKKNFFSCSGVEFHFHNLSCSFFSHTTPTRRRDVSHISVNFIFI